MHISVATFFALLLPPALTADEINPNFVHDLKRNLEKKYRRLTGESPGDAGTSVQGHDLLSRPFPLLPDDTFNGIGSRGISAQDSIDDRMKCFDSLFSTGANPYFPGGALEDYNPFTFIENATAEDLQNVCTENEDEGVMDCDVSSFFDSKRISKICRREVVGEFKTVVISDFIGEDPMPFVMRNIPYCVIDPCTPEDIALSHIFDNCQPTAPELCSDIRFTGYAGIECLAESFGLYGEEFLFVQNTTEPPTNLTEHFVLDTYLFMNETFCDITNNTNTTDYHCYADQYDKHGDVKPICESMGGSYMEVDLSFVFFTSNFEIENVPFCNSAKCQGNEALGLWDLFMELFILQANVDSKLSTIDYCFEQPKTKVFLKENTKNGVQREVTCNQLRKDGKKKEIACGQDLPPPGFELAAEACPATCGRCSEDPESEFVVHEREGVPVIKTCEWLGTRNAASKEGICKRNGMTDEISTASGACPDTCGLNDDDDDEFECASDGSDIFPLCPGLDSGAYCDGVGDCNTSLCECATGQSFCATGVNPCEFECASNYWPVCPGLDSEDFCDGEGDCNTSLCDCAAGQSFCATGVNPCEAD